MSSSFFSLLRSCLINFVSQSHGLFLEWVPVIAVAGVLVNLHCHVIFPIYNWMVDIYIMYFRSWSDLYCIVLNWNGSSSLGDNVWGKLRNLQNSFREKDLHYRKETGRCLICSETYPNMKITAESGSFSWFDPVRWLNKMSCV